MHNLALELQAQGYEVSGSDDEIYDPAYSRLKKGGILPKNLGWHPSRITSDIDLVILGMHAHTDNIELAKAMDLGLKIQSFPEFVGESSQAAQKVVICGSHGKSTITAMIMHVLSSTDFHFDYLLGGMLSGFDRMVKLRGAPVIIIEGDEYLSSRIDPTPKMLHYHGDIVIITGIEWDHKNVFPTFETYKHQFEELINQTSRKNGKIFWYQKDLHLKDIVGQCDLIDHMGYQELEQNDDLEVFFENKTYSLQIFGNHNMANLNAARLACNQLGISNTIFFDTMKSFKGVGRRLELISKDPIMYLDYAHAPSKVKATTAAVRKRYSDHQILAIFELHTYSSLDAEFLPNYKETMDDVDTAIIFFDEHALKMKRLRMLEKNFVASCFSHQNIIVTKDVHSLQNLILENLSKHEITLFMSSGNFGGMNFELFKK